jgi:MscS family membrane protein
MVVTMRLCAQLLLLLTLWPSEWARAQSDDAIAAKEKAPEESAAEEKAPEEFNPLRPVKTDSPRDTMRTFMEAMDDYRRGIDSGDEHLQQRIDSAIRTFNVQSDVLNQFNAKEAAIYLKEVIDRVIVIDYKLIPADPESGFFRLKGTEIAIRKVEGGDRAHEYLFTKDTIKRAKSFYQKVAHLPFKPGANGASYRTPWVEEYVPEWAKDETATLYHWQWIGLFLSIFLGLFVKWLVERFVNIAKTFVKSSRQEWDDLLIRAIEHPLGLASSTAIWFVCLKFLLIEGITFSILSVVIQIVFSVAMIWLFLNLSSMLSEYLKSWSQATEFPLDDQMVPLVNRALRLFVVIFGVLISIQNLGINVMSLMAGLGLGGLAFALAFKDTAANFFGSVMILWDQPFKVGDWIIADGQEGTVEEIGFRSTRIRTFYNSQISLPNSWLANVNIDNMGRRKVRRIKAELGITYDTPPEKVEAFLEGIKNIIKSNPNTVNDNFHVVFNGYGASSINILVYCFLAVKDWANELVERQKIYLEIFRLAESLGVAFAFPTQTLHVESFPEKQGPKPHQGMKVEQLKSKAQAFGPHGKDAKPDGLGIFVPPFREG